jgi:hypothetical protein
VSFRAAYFISSHGFGHAARAAAVMAAVHARQPAAHFDVFTKVPEWFFAESVRRGYRYHPLQTDVGLAQTTPLHADLGETVRRLDAFLPFNPGQVAALAGQITRAGCRLVLCDIAPLGIVVAQAAGLPSVLIENFTWDWIYAGYFDEAPRLRAYAHYLRGVFASAAYHIQTEPFCAADGAAMVASPVSRAARASAAHVRAELGVPPGAWAVLITMGGIQPKHEFLDVLAQQDIWFVVPGGSETVERRGHLLLLPHHSPIYHPDLVRACDAVVGKVGYSTLAEAFQAGTPFGYIRRPGFRESDVLASYVQAHMAGLEVPQSLFMSGDWLTLLPELLGHPRRSPARSNGADEIAALVVQPLMGGRD